MSETVDDLTVEYHEGDLMTVKELDKVILSKGAWATVMFRYQDLDRKTGEFGDDKYTIRRYQKCNGEYSQRSKFNISSRAQATQIIESLTKWIDE
jgi:hypothetical protein